jgi:hypothetical protein
MQTRRFGKRMGLVVAMTAMLAAPAVVAQQAEPAKAAVPIKAGDVLSGELNAMRVRGGKKGKRVATYELTSEPRRLPPPNGLCGLETGPETFQIVPGGAVEKLHRQGSLGQGRRGRLRPGSRSADRRCRHQMERGDEALRAAARSAVVIVIARPCAHWDRATRYPGASRLDHKRPEYRIIRSSRMMTGRFPVLQNGHAVAAMSA